ncbi:solute carrier family 28 member 3 isoform X1 [Aphidius gifuensis]|uniref:solute carrier family 28 member 3 isoform X1 n=3 Tax=Aphidius gifuensis TaxID=684658 RepID=UPI001CDC1779|nr:solute carrier family 28 member 3 isoform X1 [Aphidius gifuensis]XP_044004714.1 solute carrier family 28 member 3 isoform X1 [Aphidius gifuensis]
MAALASPVFSAVERKLSKHSLRISLDLSPVSDSIEMPQMNEANSENSDTMKNDDHSTESTYQLNDDSKSDKSWFSRNRKITNNLIAFFLHLIVLIYFTFATIHWINNNNNGNLDWCDGYGMLVVLVAIVYIGIVYYKIFKKYFASIIIRIFEPLLNSIESLQQKRYISVVVKTVFYVSLLTGLVVYLYYDTIGSRERLRSGLGFLSILIFGFVFSKHPTKVNWRPVIWGLILQIGFGLLTIRWTVGRSIFECVADKVTIFLNYAKDGSLFVFSEELVIIKSVFAFSVLPVVFFFSFMIQVLYYWGAMQWVILKLGWALSSVMGTTVCESINSAANTFLGMTESPLLIKPYISKLTASELHAIMSSGFATVSGTVLAAYINFGAQPSHLITASVMSAPAALCFSKLFYPETERSKTTFKNIPLQKSEDASVMDAATKGALAGIPLVLGIIANIIAFVSLISFLNGILGWLGGLVGFTDLTLELILSKVFLPLSWIIGVPWDQCEDVATLIGLKTVVNEFVAYQRLGELKKLGKLTPRVEGIATFAICGFANPGSVGIMMGALISMAPESRQTIASVVVRAFISGSAVCFMTAAIAGMLMDEDYFTHGSMNNIMFNVSAIK